MRGIVLAVLLTLAYAGCISTGRDGRPPRLESLPEDPCQILSPEQVAAATGLRVTEARRVVGINEIVEAQRQGHEPGPGIICSYETGSEYGIGAITIAVPAREERTATLS